MVKAVLLVGGFSGQMRPLTLTQPLPLLDFCNAELIMHQLKALKDAGASEVVICYNERQVPPLWNASILRFEAELELKLTTLQEKVSHGTAGAIKHAEALITDGGSNEAPFLVVNGDVLCTYPLRDLVHHHQQKQCEGTVLITRSETPSEYGVVVTDERTGRIRHFVQEPETFVSELINAGVYIFNPSVFRRIPAD